MLKIAVATYALFVAVSATPYRDCGSTNTLTAVRVEDCDALPCVVYHGTNVTVEYDYIATSQATTLTTNLMGTFNGVSFPWPGDFPPVCETLLTGDCPVVVGEQITVSTVLVVSSSFPQVNGIATWNTNDEIGNGVVCFQLSMTVL